jgi:hypothetical protein
MTKFKDGDKVRIIDVAESDRHLLGKTGRAQQPQGFAYRDDDMFVWFDGGGFKSFPEHQLEKVE